MFERLSYGSDIHVLSVGAWQLEFKLQGRSPAFPSLRY